MAAKTIKGITVEIDGNTTKLGNALRSVESQASDLGRSLSNVNKALKLDPTNTELLSEKQKILASYVDVTRQKLEQMEDVQDQIRQQYAAGDIDQGAYLDFQRELEYTRSKLEGLEKQQRQFGSVVSQVMQAAGEKIKDVGEKLQSVGDKVSSAGTRLMPLTAAITAAGTAAVHYGSDLIESQNKVRVAFENAADQIMAFSETTLESYGIAQGTALEMAALYGDMATSMGLPQDAAAEMAQTLVALSGDLASFKNMELEQVETALKGVFTGETESLKNLGVVMTQNNLLQFAMQQGLLDTSKSAQQLAKEQLALEKAQVAYNNAVKKYGEESLQARDAALKVADAETALSESAKVSLDTLSAAEQVQLRYAYVLNATKNAQGDFANTSDGAANSMRVASEAVKEVAADFGMLLAPYVAKAAQAVSQVLQSISALPDGTKKVVLVIAALVAGLGPLLIIVGKILSAAGSILSFIGNLPTLISGVSGALTAFSGVLSGAVTSLAGLLAGPPTSAIGAVSTAFSFLAANPIVLVFTLIIALIAALVAAFIWLWNNCEGFRQFWIDLWDTITTWCSDAIDSVVSYFSALPGRISGAISGAISTVATWGNNLKNTAVRAVTDLVSGVYNRASQVPGLIRSAIQGALSYVTSWGNSLKSQALSIMDSARNAISSGLERLKSLFRFEWSLPRIKLPHFTISGNFSLNPLSVPRIGVEWYAKGGILNGAQIFGALGGRLLGGGESGPEAVLPLDSFYSNLHTILASFLGGDSHYTDTARMMELLYGIYDRLGGLKLVLDDGTLVGRAIDAIDGALAERQRLAERGT